MKTRLLFLAALATVVGIGFLAGYLRKPSRVAPAAATPSPPAAISRTAPPDVTAPPPASSVEPEIAPPLLAVITALCDLLERRGASAADLAAFQAGLLAADPRDAIAAIRRFLRTGRDARTGRDFAIAAGGTLEGSPTLRVLLLDTLGQIARRSRSDAAAVVAREILAEKKSADEWAVALRNVGWAEPQSRAFLADRMREMLRHASWRSAPSAGMLEAFDVIVFTRDTSLIPDLEQARTAGNELAHAADIALDRLAETAPLEVLTFLNTHPAHLNDRPFLRADYFAKADLSQPAQRAQIEIYLGRPDIALAEKTKLLRALAVPASFVSNTLLTGPPPPDDGAARRATLAQTTLDWLTRDRFPTLREPLREIQQRLGNP